MKLGRPRTEDRLYNMSFVGKSKVLGTYYHIPNAIEIDREWPDRYKLFTYSQIATTFTRWTRTRI